MKYAIMSDIHSNLEALKIVVDNIHKNNVDKIICCGDIVGYGPNPNECIELLQKLKNTEIIIGNHDAAVIGKISIEDFNDYAIKAIEINKNLLSEENKLYLNNLPEIHKESICNRHFRPMQVQCRTSVSDINKSWEILFVHGSPRDPINEYLFSYQKLRENIELFKEQICFCGHTHFPLIYSYDGEEEVYNIKISQENSSEEFVLDINKKYIINVGSVGQPRDDDSRACFVYLEVPDCHPESAGEESRFGKLVFCRLKYDIPSVQKKMKNLELPEFLINRINFGK